MRETRQSVHKPTNKAGYGLPTKSNGSGGKESVRRCCLSIEQTQSQVQKRIDPNEWPFAFIGHLPRAGSIRLIVHYWLTCCWQIEFDLHQWHSKYKLVLKRVYIYEHSNYSRKKVSLWQVIAESDEGRRERRVDVKGAKRAINQWVINGGQSMFDDAAVERQQVRTVHELPRCNRSHLMARASMAHLTKGPITASIFTWPLFIES